MKEFSREFTSELFDEYWWLILISALFVYRILSLVIVDIPVFYDEARKKPVWYLGIFFVDSYISIYLYADMRYAAFSSVFVVH